MCVLEDVKYIEYRQYCQIMRIYNVEPVDGIPTTLYKETANNELDLARGYLNASREVLASVRGYPGFVCVCGCMTDNWDSVMSHCGMDRCKLCRKPTTWFDLAEFDGHCFEHRPEPTIDESDLCAPR